MQVFLERVVGAAIPFKAGGELSQEWNIATAEEAKARDGYKYISHGMLKLKTAFPYPMQSYFGYLGLETAVWGE